MVEKTYSIWHDVSVAREALPSLAAPSSLDYYDHRRYRGLVRSLSTGSRVRAKRAAGGSHQPTSGLVLPRRPRASAQM